MTAIAPARTSISQSVLFPSNMHKRSGNGVDIQATQLTAHGVEEKQNFLNAV
jgi:hypothetical protein